MSLKPSPQLQVPWLVYKDHAPYTVDDDSTPYVDGWIFNYGPGIIEMNGHRVEPGKSQIMKWDRKLELKFVGGDAYAHGVFIPRHRS